MLVHRRASRALALAGAAAALAVPGTAVAIPIDAQPQGSRADAAIHQNGPPTWPANPQPLNAAHAPADDDGGTAWSTIAVAVAVAVAGVVAGVALVTRRPRRPGEAA
ncbi:MAG TPA: hypothetical protein VH834_13745 [Solirubrobacteraceae bacterium]|jgi:hypothetical protein